VALLTTLESTLGENGLGLVQVQESVLSEERHPAPGKDLHSGETNDMVGEVQEGGPSEESQLALGKRLHLGENRAAQEGL
jgi:hypothetical protein